VPKKRTSRQSPAEKSSPSRKRASSSRSSRKLPPGRLVTAYSHTRVGAAVMVKTMVEKYGCALVDAPRHDSAQDVWRYSYVDPALPPEPSDDH